MATRGAPISLRGCILQEGSSVAEDDGYLVGYLMNGRDTKTEVVVFTHNVAQGPILSVASGLYSAPIARDFMPGFTPVLTDDVKSSFADTNC
jgi:hypothetical protein